MKLREFLKTFVDENSYIRLYMNGDEWGTEADGGKYKRLSYTTSSNECKYMAYCHAILSGRCFNQFLNYEVIKIVDVADPVQEIGISAINIVIDT